MTTVGDYPKYKPSYVVRQESRGTIKVIEFERVITFFHPALIIDYDINVSQIFLISNTHFHLVGQFICPLK